MKLPTISILLLALCISLITTTDSQLTEEETLIAQWFSRSQDRDHNSDLNNEEKDSNWISVNSGAATTDTNWNTEYPD